MHQSQSERTLSWVMGATALTVVLLYFIAALGPLIPEASAQGKKSASITIFVSSSGTVQLSSGLPSCTSSKSPCRYRIRPGQTIRLSARADSGWRFWQWSSPCGSATTCSIKARGARNVSASFTELPPPPPALLDLVVRFAGAGKGSVSAGSELCQSTQGTCTLKLEAGDVISLTANPAQGSTFQGWRGACTGSSGCSLRLTSPMEVTAEFAVKPPPTLALNDTRAISAIRQEIRKEADKAVAGLSGYSTPSVGNCVRISNSTIRCRSGMTASKCEFYSAVRSFRVREYTFLLEVDAILDLSGAVRASYVPGGSVVSMWTTTMCLNP
jgi:hypothetical protein